MTANPEMEVEQAISNVHHGPLNRSCDDDWEWKSYHHRYEINEICGYANCGRMHYYIEYKTNGVGRSRVLNNGRYYWQVLLEKRGNLVGNLAVGICITDESLRWTGEENLLGMDSNGWGLSNSGLLWHNGCCIPYTKPFCIDKVSNIGVLFDGANGTLAFYKDGISMGVAFWGLDKVRKPLYPAIYFSNYAEINSTMVKKEFISLQEHARAVIVKVLRGASWISCCNCESQECVAEWAFLMPLRALKQLPLPLSIMSYIQESLEDVVPLYRRDWKKCRQACVSYERSVYMMTNRV